MPVRGLSHVSRNYGRTDLVVEGRGVVAINSSWLVSWVILLSSTGRALLGAMVVQCSWYRGHPHDLKANIMTRATLLA